jgi:hypothetical protein
MSTASRYRATVCKARAASRNAAGVPGAGMRPPTHHDVGVPIGFPYAGCARTRNEPVGSGQPRTAKAIRSVNLRPAQILAPDGGFPSSNLSKPRRKAAKQQSPPPYFSMPP